MQRDRISGIAIIVSCLMAIVTMVLHPIGGDLRTDIDHLQRIAAVAFWIHALALASIGVQVFGFLGLRRVLGPDRALVRAGLVAFAIAWVAVFGAAMSSGMLGPEIISHYADLPEAERAAMHVLWEYNFMINQALDKVWVTGTCLGAVLWSAAMWGRDRWWRSTAVLGFLVGSVGLLGLAGGDLRMNITGVGLFIGGFSVWAIAAGTLMCCGRDADPPVRDQEADADARRP